MDIPDAVEVPWAQSRRFPAGEDMAALDNVHAFQCRAERLAFLRCNAGIDINGVNRPVAGSVATTVATGLPASGEIH